MCSVNNFDQLREIYLFEQHRAETYKEWPLKDSALCNIQQMAEAGFYWSGNKKDTDTVTCFVCEKTLCGWDPTDNPWEEHAKHAPQCLFVKYGHKEKELTVEEFLNVFAIAVKNKILREVNITRNNFIKDTNNEVERFRSI